MSEIEFRGRLTEDQYLKLAAFIWPKFLGLTPYFLFLGAGILVWRTWPLSVSDPWRILQVLIIVALGVAMLFSPKRAARKAWRAEPLLQEEVSGTVNEAGVEWGREGKRVKVEWSSILKMRESPDLLLLYRTPRQFLYIMKSFFPNEESWEAALALAREQASARKQSGSG